MRDDPDVATLLEEVRASAKKELSAAQVAERSRTGSEDRNRLPLKALQGMIWEGDTASRRFCGHIYEDAVRKLRNGKHRALISTYFRQDPSTLKTPIRTHRIRRFDTTVFRVFRHSYRRQAGTPTLTGKSLGAWLARRPPSVSLGYPGELDAANPPAFDVPTGSKAPIQVPLPIIGQQFRCHQYFFMRKSIYESYQHVRTKPVSIEPQILGNILNLAR